MSDPSNLAAAAISASLKDSSTGMFARSLLSLGMLLAPTLSAFKTKLLRYCHPEFHQSV